MIGPVNEKIDTADNWTGKRPQSRRDDRTGKGPKSRPSEGKNGSTHFFGS